MMGAHHAASPGESLSPHDGSIRKRVCKACDRCRLKKSKCDGSSPCSRCKADNAICVFGERKKSHDKIYPKGYVEMLENQQAQLVTGLQELYRRLQNGQGWVGSPLQETSQGNPLTHDILERLGALKTDSHPSIEDFEEDLSALQKRLLANGAGYVKREASSDDGSEIAQSPVYEHANTKSPTFSNPFTQRQLPPTPPSQSPYPQSSGSLPQLRTHSLAHPLVDQSGMNPALLQRQSWHSPQVGYDDNMDFINRFDSPISFETIPPRMLEHQTAASMNACLPMRDWMEEDDFQRYFSPTMAYGHVVDVKLDYNIQDGDFSKDNINFGAGLLDTRF